MTMKELYKILTSNFTPERNGTCVPSQILEGRGECDSVLDCSRCPLLTKTKNSCFYKRFNKWNTTDKQDYIKFIYKYFPSVILEEIKEEESK